MKFFWRRKDQVQHSMSHRQRQNQNDEPNDVAILTQINRMHGRTDDLQNGLFFMENQLKQGQQSQKMQHEQMQSQMDEMLRCQNWHSSELIRLRNENRNLKEQNEKLEEILHLLFEKTKILEEKMENLFQKPEPEPELEPEPEPELELEPEPESESESTFTQDLAQVLCDLFAKLF